MLYNIEIVKNNVLATMRGELDDHYARQIREKLDFVLMRKEITGVIFDLSELEFMDSSGIGLLMGRYRLIRNRAGRAALICKNEKIIKLLKMSGILQIFSLYETRTECFGEMTKEAGAYNG